MSRTVVVTREAEANADKIYDWIAARSPEGARLWYRAYLAALAKLTKSVLPETIAPEAQNFGEPLLQSIFHTRQGHRYRLIFRLMGEEIHVLYVRGFGQDIVA
jgi:plasmid stabilization system protein ParE